MLLEDVEGLEMPAWVLCNSWLYGKEHFLFHKVTERHLSWCLGRPCLKVWAAWRLFFALSPDICAMSVYTETCRPKYIPYVCVCMVCMQIYMVCIWYMPYTCHMPHIWDFFYLSIHIYMQPYIFIFAHAMIKVCLKNKYFLLLLFHWIQTQTLDSEEEVFIK